MCLTSAKGKQQQCFGRKVYKVLQEKNQKKNYLNLPSRVDLVKDSKGYIRISHIKWSIFKLGRRSLQHYAQLPYFWSTQSQKAA